VNPVSETSLDASQLTPMYHHRWARFKCSELLQWCNVFF